MENFLLKDCPSDAGHQDFDTGDKIFQSRRAPTAGYLYLICFVATVLMIPFLQNGWMLGVIGTHGMLSGTATQDFAAGASLPAQPSAS